MNIDFDFLEKVSRLEGHVLMLQRTLEYQTSLMVSAHADIGSVREENKYLRETIKTQKDSITLLQEEVIILRSQVETLTNERAHYVQEVQKYKSMFEFIERENNALREEIRRLNIS